MINIFFEILVLMEKRKSRQLCILPQHRVVNTILLTLVQYGEEMLYHFIANMANVRVIFQHHL